MVTNSSTQQVAAKRKLFIVEDDPELSEMLTAFFRVQGYDVANAMWGEEAVEAIQSDPPDLALLDIRLPDIDGYEVCRRLRSTRRTQNLPVIFLTERSAMQDKLNGLELGAVDYITKPFSTEELNLRVRNALRRTSFATLHNPVTRIPEGVLVRERIEQSLPKTDWGVVLVRVKNLDTFRARYGFVAADDVARAVVLMLGNTIKDTGTEGDFLGHVSANEFIIVTQADKVKPLADRSRLRLEPSMAYYYPALERSQLHTMPESERLQVQIVTLSAYEHRADSVDQLFNILKNRLAQM